MPAKIYPTGSECPSFKHGHCINGVPTRTYWVWAAMLDRCRNPRNKDFPNYGGRGIAVCEQWSEFLNFVKDMGNKLPGMTLERINNDGPYAPGNVKWATRKEQNTNTRRNKIYTVNGVTGCMADLARHFGLSVQTVSARIHKYNWPTEKAFTPSYPTSRNPHHQP
jgi:hypothetical protein